MLEAVGSITESSDASSLKAYDRTGIYKTTEPRKNLTGWGGINPNYTQATGGKLQIKFPDQVTLLPQKDFYIIPSTGLDYIDIWTDSTTRLPNVIKRPFIINASDLNFPVFPMGIYEFLISYTGSWGVTVYKWKLRYAFIAQACCCVKALQAELECGCQDTIKRDDWMNGVVALAAVMSDMKCLKQNKTAEAINRLKDICQRNPCAPCRN